MPPARESSAPNSTKGPRALRSAQNNSSRVSSPANQPATTCDDQVDYIAQLDGFVKQKQLPSPTYKTTNLYSQKYPNKPLPQKAAGQFVSQVSIVDMNGENSSFTTFPEVFATTGLAMRAVAKKAYQHIKGQETAEQAKRAPCGQSLIMKRIEQIVARELAGFHSDAVEDEYKKNFAESLPSNWIDLARKNELLAVETFPAFNKTTTTIRLKRPAAACDASSVTSLTEHPDLYPTQAKHALKSQVACGDASHLMKQVSNITLNPSSDASATTPSCLFSPKVSLQQQQTQNTSVPKGIKKKAGPTKLASYGSSVILPTRANPASSAAQQAKNSFSSKYSNSISNEGANRVFDDPQSNRNSPLILANEPVKRDVVIAGGTEIRLPEIPLPVLPPPLLDFDVLVTHVESPSSFWVQKFECSQPSSEFAQLLLEMKKFYDNEEESIELNPDLVREGSYFAAKHLSLWYRVLILSTYYESSDPLQLDRPLIVRAFFLDLGFMLKLNYRQLQPLYSAYRFLPRQAYHVCLSSVQPANSNGTWSQEALQYFENATRHKSFVSRIDSIKMDPENVNEYTIFLKSLIYTWNDDDLIIAKELVKRGFAIEISIK